MYDYFRYVLLDPKYGMQVLRSTINDYKILTFNKVDSRRLG